MFSSFVVFILYSFVLLILSILSIVVGILVLVFSQYYLFELALSFLPYAIVLGLMVLWYWSVVLWRERKRAHMVNNVKYIGKKQGFHWVLWICTLVLLFFYVRPFVQFYDVAGIKQMLHFDSIDLSQENGVKILFANIYWQNEQYDELEAMITKYDPDVVMFVEFAAHHYEHLNAFLSKKYKYTNRATWSKSLMVWSMVFSKFEINNLADDFEQWAWRYGYFAINLWWEDVYFYLVHTSSPISKEFFEMRNVQFSTFINDLKKHKNLENADNVLAVGDFNVSPWSQYYQILEEWFAGKMRNVTKETSWIFTWHSPALPFLWTHIDHLFVSSGINIMGLQSVNVVGSDHRGYIFDLSLVWVKKSQ